MAVYQSIEIWWTGKPRDRSSTAVGSGGCDRWTWKPGSGNCGSHPGRRHGILGGSRRLLTLPGTLTTASVEALIKVDGSGGLGGSDGCTPARRRHSNSMAAAIYSDYDSVQEDRYVEASTRLARALSFSFVSDKAPNWASVVGSEHRGERLELIGGVMCRTWRRTIAGVGKKGGMR
ncbi:hypothetical protein LINGRAHAP2_LOCUS36364, partial [Linum grandiflorum]